MDKLQIIIIFILSFISRVRGKPEHRIQEWAAENASAFNITLQPSQNTLLGGKPTILIGMMFTDLEPLKKIEAYRQSLRNFTDSGDSKCDIKIFFFFGHSASKTSMNGTDIVRGNFPENMNTGKTREWIRWAVSWFEKNKIYADPRSVVIKMDSDTAVRWEELDRLVPQFMAPTYFGKLHGIGLCNTRLWMHCLVGIVPPNNCTCAECTLKEGLRGKCWYYMKGGLYGVSLSIAEKMVECWHQEFIGIEDALFGLTIKRCQIQVHTHQVSNKVFYHSPRLKEYSVAEVDVWDTNFQRPRSYRQGQQRHGRRA